MMARPRQYDREAVLDAAMRLFWERGYEATSVDELVAATGLNRASMYNAFGDKQGLFLAAADHYAETVTRARLQMLDAPGSAVAAIGRFFDEMIAFSRGSGRRLGCLLTNCAIELVPHEAEVAARWRAALSRLEDALQATIRRGQEQGEIPVERDARALARSLVATVQGLRVLARSDVDEAVLRDAAKVALEVLRAPASGAGERAGT